LPLNAIIKKEGIKASEEEVDAKIKEIMERQQQKVELDDIKKQFAKQGRLDYI